MERRTVIFTILLAIVGEILSDLYLFFTTGAEFLLPLLFRLLITVSLGFLVLFRRGWARWGLLIFIINNIVFAALTLWNSFSYLSSFNILSLLILLVCELGAACMVISSQSVKSHINSSTDDQYVTSVT